MLCVEQLVKTKLAIKYGFPLHQGFFALHGVDFAGRGTGSWGPGAPHRR